MRSLKLLITTIKTYGFKHKALYAMSFLILFWCLFDGILDYILPLVITGGGLSKTMMGIIIGSSSVAGFVFDIFLCKILKSTNVRRTYLILFIICAIYPLILLNAKTVWIFLIAMGVWGIYYDLFNIGKYDFVGRYTEKEEHASSSGVLQVFLSIGYLLAPLFAGLIIGGVIGKEPFILSWIFLGIAFVFFIVLLIILKKNKVNKLTYDGENKKVHNKYTEWHIWRNVGKLILPVLILTFVLNLIDATFWTVGPLLVDSWADLGIFGTLFMTAYLLPPLFVGWFIGPATSKLGKKKTANICLLIASLLFASLFAVNNHIAIIAIVFIATIFLDVSFPANSATYADYISESGALETEIESQADFATNLGYVIGPMLAGFLADTFSNIAAFSIVGLIGIGVAILLLFITPRKITVTLNQ